MKKSTTAPDAYIESLPDNVKPDIAKLDRQISRIMQDQSRVLWEGVFWGGSRQHIIGYGDYSNTRSDGKTVEWFIVGLAVQKNYISLYVNAVEDKQYLAEKYADTLGKVKVGKSNISFKSLHDINLEAVLELVKKAKEQS